MDDRLPEKDNCFVLQASSDWLHWKSAIYLNTWTPQCSCCCWGTGELRDRLSFSGKEMFFFFLVFFFFFWRFVFVILSWGKRTISSDWFRTVLYQGSFPDLNTVVVRVPQFNGFIRNMIPAFRLFPLGKDFSVELEKRVGIENETREFSIGSIL